VRALWIIAGVAICAAGLWLLYSGASLMEANLRTGSFNLRFWEAYFWLKQPPVLEHGLADNGRSWLYLLGGALTGALGWGTLKMARGA
jgi:ABC-type Na+ efflux pump permease subunit